MGKRTDSRTWRISRYSSLGYGVMVNDVLPSKGVDACVYSGRCPSAFKMKCVAGRRCPHEDYLLNRFISSARTHYAYAKTWLTNEEFEQTIQSLAILPLQKARLSARISKEAPFNDELVSEGVSCHQVGISIDRYATALHRRQQSLTYRLLDAETASYWQGV